MVLPCPGKAQSKSTRRVLRDAGAWTSAAVRKNQEVKLRRLHAFRSAEFKSATDREISKWLANQVTEKAVRTAGLEPMFIWCSLTMNYIGTAKAQIVLLSFQDCRLGTLATASPTISLRALSQSVLTWEDASSTRET